MEVASGMDGINRIYYVTNEGKANLIYPDDRSFRGMRLRFDKRFPLVIIPFLALHMVFF